jgi:hypothetical protein
MGTSDNAGSSIGEKWRPKAAPLIADASFFRHLPEGGAKALGMGRAGVCRMLT